MANPHEESDKIGSTCSDRVDSGYDSKDGSSLGTALSIRSRGKLLPKTITVRTFEDVDIPQPTIERFQDLQRLFNNPLHEYLCKSCKHIGDISIKLKVLGETREAARPCVVIQCDASMKRKIKKYYDQPEVKLQYQPSDQDLEVYPRLDVYVFSHAPRRIALDHPYDAYIADHANQHDLAWKTFCGSLIKIQWDSEPRLATLGGLICTRAGVYGMTAGHVFAHLDNIERVRSTTESSDSLAASLDDGDSEDEFDVVLEANNDDVESPIQRHQHLNSGGIPSDETDDPLSWATMASIVKVSNNLDWALIPLHGYSQTLPNLRASNHNIVKPIEIGLDSTCPMLGFPGLGRKVQAPTMTTNFPEYGCLKSTSFLSLQGGSGFVETYDLRFDNGSSPQAGQCGSWVVDAQDSWLYGHVIASDIFDEAYVIPIQDTFEDIRQQLRVDSITFPKYMDTEKIKRGLDELRRPTSSSSEGMRVNLLTLPSQHLKKNSEHNEEDDSSITETASIWTSDSKSIFSNSSNISFLSSDKSSSLFSSNSSALSSGPSVPGANKVDNNGIIVGGGSQLTREKSPLRVSGRSPPRKKRGIMEELNENLRSYLSPSAPPKLSNSEILTSTSNYIVQLEVEARANNIYERQLRLTNHDLELAKRDNETLRHENQRLTKELQLLKQQQQQQPIQLSKMYTKYTVPKYGGPSPRAFSTLTRSGFGSEWSNRNPEWRVN